MKKLHIVLTIIALFFSSTFAQERGEREKPRSDREKTAEQNGRGAYGYGSGEIKVADPADWAKNLEKPIFSGPQPGEKVPSFTATNLRGENAGQELDPVAMAKGKLHLLVFVSKARTFGRILGQLADQLQTIEKNSKQPWAMSVIVCNDDANSVEKDFAIMDQRYPKNLIMALCKDGSAGPPAYGLDKNLTATVIVAKDGKVLHNLPYVTDAFYTQPHILGALANAMEVDHDTIRKYIGNTPGDARTAYGRGRGQQRRGGDSDSPQAKLRAKLGELVQAGKITRKEAGELFTAAFPENARGR